VTFRRRAYPEVLENLLTGGIAAEAQPFPPDGAGNPPFRMPLEQAQVRDVISVHGTRNGLSHRFRKGTDFQLDAGVLVWPEGAELPDPGTVVVVNYFGPPRPGPATDIHTGSVLRTLAESVALEIAGLHAQLEAVYDSAFIDTAEGRSLDNVVALLGIERVRGGRATTQLQFTRSPGSRGVVTIPAGTRVMDESGDVEYATTETATLPPEQKTVRVAARDLEANDPVAAASLVVLPVPIEGIVGVSNPAPAVIGTRDESDDELRTRAKSFLHGSERATIGALRNAVSRQGGGISVEVVEDETQPGFVDVLARAEAIPPTLRQRLLTAIKDVKPAGVRVQLVDAAAPRRIDLELRLMTSSSLLEQDLRAAHDAVKKRIADYFAKLPVAQAASLNKLVGLALGVNGVEDVRILTATLDDGTDVLDREAGILEIEGVPTTLGSLRVADSNLATTLLVLVSYPKGEAPPDPNAIRARLDEAVAYINLVNAAEPPPAGSPDAGAASLRRVLKYGELLLATPVPGFAGGDLAEHDALDIEGSAPPLPDASTILPYRVTFVFKQTTGLVSRLTQGTQSYTLTPFERLSLGGVEVAESANG
jgi:uncharacterized phage protein gp47/JayE